MSRAEKFVKKALDEEAARASSPDRIVDLVLDQAPQHARRRRLFPIVFAAVTVLLVWVVSHGTHQPRVSPRSTPGSTFDQFSQPYRLTSSHGSAHQLGHLDLGYHGVHVELVAGDGPDHWHDAWQHPCQQSLLMPLARGIPSEAACAVSAHDAPRWEILVSPRYATAPIRSPWFRWATPVSRACVAIGTPFGRDGIIHRYPAWLTSVRGHVRYQGDRGWTPRTWRSIYFPEQDAQVSILAPNHAGAMWLAGHIVVA